MRIPMHDGAALEAQVTSRLPNAALLDGVVAELQQIERRTGIERTLAIGELVLNRFFGGDPAAWSDRRRNKNNSIRRLAERADCPFCRSALNEAVGVYVAVRALPCVRTYGHICASHVASVLRLPLLERQRMLEHAERERWTVRELRQRVVALRRADGERRGRPSTTAETKLLARLSSRATELKHLVGELGDLRPFGPDLGKALSGLATELIELHSLVEALNSGPGVTRSGMFAIAIRDRSA